MTHPVLDLGSNLEENLQRWSKALKSLGSKLDVWNVIYSGKRKHWSAKEISEELKGKVSPKRVTEAGKKLLGDGLVSKIPGRYPIVYEKIDDVHHHKPRILGLVYNKAKRDALPTKRDRARVTVNVKQPKMKQGEAVEITIDDIDQFKRVRRLNKNSQKPVSPLPESRFKKRLQRLFRDYGEHKDHGGEIDDFYTNQLRMGDKRYSAAFALKGPGVGVKVVTPGKWGKQGNQIQRLLHAPARVFLLQSELQIDEYSVEQLMKLAQHKASQENRKLFYGYIDPHDSTRLRKAYPNAFKI
jgi:hypothetical protein